MEQRVIGRSNQKVSVIGLGWWRRRRDRRVALDPALCTLDNILIGTIYGMNFEVMPPLLARALRDGDWDILEGVRFNQFRRAVHVIEPEQLPIPITGVPLGVGVDYGLAAPFCALWGAVFPDNLVVIYRELYQADLTPEQQAKLVKASERPGERIPGRPLPVALDPSCWQRPATTITKPIEPDTPAEGSIAWWYRRELGVLCARRTTTGSADGR